MIRVLPPPKHRPVHTCPRCGGHCVSHIAMSSGFGDVPYLKVCSWCLWVYHKPSRQAERRREIEEAIEDVVWN